jgi:uncharacterized protein (DUF1684 family)
VNERLQVASWRREVAELYAQVRAIGEPRDAHAVWQSRRDELFTGHPASPLLPEDPLRATGLPYWPYDPVLRWQLPIEDAAELTRDVPTAGDGVIHLVRIGQLRLPDPIDASLDVWWLAQYGGGVFLPIHDATSGQDSYGGGRYLLDTAKGADLGGDERTMVVDLNFGYHPSCRYNPRWECPLAPEGNRLDTPIRAGERLSPRTDDEGAPRGAKR